MWERVVAWSKRRKMTMRLSITFSTYLGRQFLAWFFAIFLLFAGLILLFDVIELLRRTSARPDATLVLLDGVNHVLKQVPAGDRAANIASYDDPDLPLAPGVAEAIADFVEAER